MANVTLGCRRVRSVLFLAGLSSGWALACGSEGSSSPGSLGGLGGSASAAAGASGSSGAPSGGAPAAGSGGTPASGGSEGQPDLGGVSGSAGTSGSSGAIATPDAGAMVPEPEGVDERPFFSFFVTSQAGLFGLPAGEFAPAPSATDGYGGNFGGLAGADEICTMLARASNPTDRKTWRAFLSTSGFDGSTPVDAIDRVGGGPWYDYNGQLLAANLEGLLPQDDGRPAGDAQLVNMFTDENGEDIRPSQEIDNHDTLTGSGPNGRLFDDEADGRVATCENWTSSTLRGEQGNGFGGGGQVPVGHSWPRSNNNGRQWIQDHTVNGCEPGANVEGGGGAEEGDFRVGAGGGFGGIYCFALGAVAPE